MALECLFYMEFFECKASRLSHNQSSSSQLTCMLLANFQRWPMPAFRTTFTKHQAATLGAILHVLACFANPFGASDVSHSAHQLPENLAPTDIDHHQQQAGLQSPMLLSKTQEVVGQLWFSFFLVALLWVTKGARQRSWAKWLWPRAFSFSLTFASLEQSTSQRMQVSSGCQGMA